MTDEKRAIARLKRGEIGGLEFLVRRYQVQAVRSAYLVTHDVSLAEEVVQSAFLRAYERIVQFDTARSFGPWFFTSVLHDAVKAARAHAKYVPLGMESDESPAGASAVEDRSLSPAEHVEQAETATEIWAALQILSPDQRAVIVARYYLDLSEADLASELAIPVSTAKWRLHAAKQRLRILLHHIAPE